VDYETGRRFRVNGDLESARRHIKESIKSFKKARELDPDDSMIWINIGSACAELSRIARLENRIGESLQAAREAEQVYREVLTRASRDRRREIQMVRRNFASLYMETGRPKLAIRQLERYLEDFPGDATGHYLMGQALLQTREYDAALDSLNRSIKLNPSSRSWQALAAVYHESGEIDQAIEAYEKAVELAPNSPELRFQLGLLFREKGEVYFAIQQFQQATRLDKSGKFAPLIAQQVRAMTERNNESRIQR
jgi:tetratricopeptide (TPR) repeat protein